MNPTLQHRPFDFGKAAAYVLLFIMLLCLITCGQSCMSIKKATQKVITNKEAFDTVGKLYIDLHPCVKDSVVTFLPGETTILVDSVQTYLPGDTINTLRVDTLVTFITKTVNRVDTFRASVKDLQTFKILTKDYEKLLAENNSQQGKIYQLEKIDIEQKQTIQRQKLYIWGPWVFILIGMIVYIFIKSKVPFLNLKKLG